MINWNQTALKLELNIALTILCIWSKYFSSAFGSSFPLFINNELWMHPAVDILFIDVH